MEIQLTGSRDQLNLLQKNIAYNPTIKKLIEHREILSQHLCEGNKPLETLNEKLQGKLRKQLDMKTKLREVEKQLEKSNQILHELEQKYSLIQKYYMKRKHN